MKVYLTDISAFLPNGPIANHQMESILGMINNTPSRVRNIILRSNKIKERYYALDPKTGKTTHTNARLTAEAVRRLSPYEGFSTDQIQYLSCGTSSPDQIMPGHGVMVHGELGGGPCEVVTTAGICLSGLTALKNAYMNVAMGLSKNAVATGSELASTYLRARMGASTDDDREDAIEKNPVLAFEGDFLRWMLSDGAGAAFLTGRPDENRLSLRVDWIEIVSYAHRLPTCMYAGGIKTEDGTITGWREFDSPADAAGNGTFLIKQDVKLLNSNIISVAVDMALSRVAEKHALHSDDVTWFLPHYSSSFFREPLMQRMADIGFKIPQERWFTNLTYKGNTGSASFYIILEELFHSGRLRRGDRLLCMVPESGRFSIGYMLLTTV